MRNAKTSGLTDANGWVRVDEKSLRSTEFPNVFALGDCANTTNKKTAAAVGETKMMTTRARDWMMRFF